MVYKLAPHLNISYMIMDGDVASYSVSFYERLFNVFT